MVRKHSYRIRENMYGGNGKIYIFDVLSKEETNVFGRMYAKVVLPPQSSIGWHVHKKEVEPYYVICGQGLFIDNFHEEFSVSDGSVCIIKPGEGHGIRNISKDKDLVIMALVYNIYDEGDTN